MNIELKEASDNFIARATARLNELFQSRSNEGNKISRMVYNLDLWKKYLTDEANQEGYKFTDEINLPKYGHISEEEKLKVQENHNIALKDLIMTYNKKMLLNE